VLKRLDGKPEGVPVNGWGVAWADVVERSEGVLQEASTQMLSNAWRRVKDLDSEAKGLSEKIARRVQECRQGTAPKASGSQCASAPINQHNLDTQGCLVCGGEHAFDINDGTLFADLYACPDEAGRVVVIRSVTDRGIDHWTEGAEAHGGNTVAHCAAINLWQSTLLEIANTVPQLLVAQNEQGQTPLHLLLDRVHIASVPLHIVQQLISLVPTEGWLLQDNNANSLLHLAVRSAHPALVQSISDRASTKVLQLQDAHGRNLFFFNL